MSNGRRTNFSELSRRHLLQGLGAVGVGVAAPGCGGSGSSSNQQTGGAGGTPASGGASGMLGSAGSAGSGMGGSTGVVGCVLTTEQAGGPFFIDTGLERSDITEGKAGVPLDVQLTFADVPGCAPVTDAVVELWHSDALGVYSGFDIADGNLADVAGATFLRGYQRTDASGVVRFQTIYPGWYPSRTPHLHIYALIGGDALITTQLYFEEALNDRVYTREPYAGRGTRDTTNADDFVSRLGDAPGTDVLLLNVSEVGNGLAGEFVIGVDRGSS